MAVKRTAADPGLEALARLAGYEAASRDNPRKAREIHEFGLRQYRIDTLRRLIPVAPSNDVKMGLIREHKRLAGQQAQAGAVPGTAVPARPQPLIFTPELEDAAAWAVRTIVAAAGTGHQPGTPLRRTRADKALRSLMDHIQSQIRGYHRDFPALSPPEGAPNLAWTIPGTRRPVLGTESPTGAGRTMRSRRTTRGPRRGNDVHRGEHSTD